MLSPDLGAEFSDYAEPILGSLKPHAPVSMRPANRRSNFGDSVTRRLRSYHLWLLAVGTRIEPRTPAAIAFSTFSGQRIIMPCVSRVSLLLTTSCAMPGRSSNGWMGSTKYRKRPAWTLRHDKFKKLPRRDGPNRRVPGSMSVDRVS